MDATASTSACKRHKVLLILNLHLPPERSDRAHAAGEEWILIRAAILAAAIDGIRRAVTAEVTANELKAAGFEIVSSEERSKRSFIVVASKPAS